MSKQKISRFCVYVFGLFILAMGLILNTKANLGVSPIISVPYCISEIFNLNFGNLTFVVYCIFVVIQIVIHFRLKDKEAMIMDLFQLPLSLCFTRVLNLFSAYIPNASTMVQSFVLLLIAIVLTGIGAAMSLSMQIIPNPGDGIVQAIARAMDKSVGFTKNIFDLLCVCITVCLGMLCTGGIVGIGIGTLIAVLGVGRVIALFHYLFKDKIQILINAED